MREIVSPLSGIRSPFGQLTSPLAIYAVLGIKPQLVFDFANGRFFTMSSRTTFDDAITHSRTSNATMVDSDGLVKWAPHNLLTYSDDFTDAAWLVANGSVTSNATTAPDGTLSGDTFTADGAFGILRQVISVSPNTRYTFSFWAQNIDATAAFYRAYDQTNAADIVSATNYFSEISSGSWTLITFSFTTPATCTSVGVYTASGDQGGSVAFWGAHLYRSDLGGMVDNPDRGDSYVPTTSSARYLARRGHHVYNGSAWVNKGMMHESEARTNLVTYSEDFTDASWNKINILSANVDATGPDGLTSATSLVETTANASHYTYSLTGALAANWTATVYIKQKSPNRYLQLRPYGVGSGIAYATFDPADGSLYDSGGSGLVTTTSSPVGNGWYRVSMTCSSALPAADDGITITLTDGTLGEVPSYTGDGTSGVYIYGAQVEAASTPSSYIPTSGATATRAADTLTVPSANLPWPTVAPLAVCIQMEGDMTYADTGASIESVFSRWTLDANNRIEHRLDTNSAATGQVTFLQTASGTNDIVNSPGAAYSPGINVPFNIASRHGSTFINGAVDGTALTADLTPVALPDLSSTDLELAYDFMGTIKLFRIWAADLGDTGIAEASN